MHRIRSHSKSLLVFLFSILIKVRFACVVRRVLAPVAHILLPIPKIGESSRYDLKFFNTSRDQNMFFLSWKRNHNKYSFKKSEIRNSNLVELSDEFVNICWSPPWTQNCFASEFVQNKVVLKLWSGNLHHSSWKIAKSIRRPNIWGRKLFLTSKRNWKTFLFFNATDLRYTVSCWTI